MTERNSCFVLFFFLSPFVQLDFRPDSPVMTTIAHGQYPQRRPNGLWRGASAMVMGLTCSISKGFLNGFNSLEVVGLDNFVKLLEERADPYERQRGLITGTKCTTTTSTHTLSLSCLPSRTSAVSLTNFSSHVQSATTYQCKSKNHSHKHPPPPTPL